MRKGTVTLDDRIGVVIEGHGINTIECTAGQTDRTGIRKGGSGRTTKIECACIAIDRAAITEAGHITKKSGPSTCLGNRTGIINDAIGTIDRRCIAITGDRPYTVVGDRT